MLALGLLVALVLAIAGLALALRKMSGNYTKMTKILADMAYPTQTNQFIFHKGEHGLDSFELARDPRDAPEKPPMDNIDDFDTPQDVGDELK